jgi:hypothetical protein
MKSGYEEWISGSAFRDEGGAPRVWFHGTDADHFNVFARWDDASIGFHFGDRTTAQNRLEMIYRMAEETEGSVIPVLCRARNPLRLRDQFMWDQDDVANALLAVGILNSQDEVDFVVEACSATMIFAVIEEAGHDCVVYGNLCEDEANGSDSLMVWRAEMLKHADATSFDLEDPKLLPQNPASASDIQRWRELSQEIAADRAALREFRSDPEAWFAQAASVTL